MTWLAISLFLTIPFTVPLQDDGTIRVQSTRGMNETVTALEAAIAARNITVFAKVDHAANARTAGMELRPTTLLIIGTPAVGTRLMQCSQTAAIDLPLRILVWQDEAGLVWVGYTDPSVLDSRHRLQDCRETVERVKGVLVALAAAAAGKSP